jgi:hypothetical protein
MDNLESYREIIRRILNELAKVPYSYGDLRCVPVFDREHDRYLLVTQGWDDQRRVHGTIVHIDIINGKIWVQRDSTNVGIVRELEEAGVPKDQIVLGFHQPHVRPLTDYAVA